MIFEIQLLLSFVYEVYIKLCNCAARIAGPRCKKRIRLEESGFAASTLCLSSGRNESRTESPTCQQLVRSNRWTEQRTRSRVRRFPRLQLPVARVRCPTQRLFLPREYSDHRLPIPIPRSVKLNKSSLESSTYVNPPR